MQDFTCLAIETATEVASVALVHNGVALERRSTGLAAPSREIYAWITGLLAEAGLGLDDLDCVAFGAGPGAFTGVRVATAVAQALGYARQLPICPVSTLAALAAGALRHSPASVVACCQDARMGQVYFALYGRDPELGVSLLAPEALLDPAAVATGDNPDLACAGSGWRAYPELVRRLGLAGQLLEVPDLPAALDVARLAWPMYRDGRAVSPAQALPNYLRDQVAALPAGRG